MIPVFKPYINKQEVLAELEKIFDSGWIGLGPKVIEFEEMFAKYIGVKYAVAVNSCTAALHLANVVLGVKEGDEVIVPSLTFVSTALSALYCKATVVFADIDEETLCIDPDDVKRKMNSKTKAIIPVHYGGHACAMYPLFVLAEDYDVLIIEDVAHGCGGKYMNNMLGSIGNIGCFSFHAVKNLATGDGGMITTNDEKIYQQLKKLRWLGIDKDTWLRNDKKYSWQYTINDVGYKYHMNDINAVIGISQLKLLDSHNLRRKEITKKYNEAFSELDWIKTPVEKNYTSKAYHNYVIRTPYRDDLLEYLSFKGISAGVHYEPVHHFAIFGDNKVDLPVTEKVYKELLTLPLYPSMTEEEVYKVIYEVKNFK